MANLHAVCDASLLSAGLRAVLPHVARADQETPALTGVGLTLTGGRLVLQASDRSTMAVYRFDARGGGSAVWTPESAKAVTAWAKGMDGDVEIDGGTLVAPGGEHLEVEAVDAVYPDVDALVSSWAARPAAGPAGPVVVGIDPALLGRFSRTDLSQHPGDKGHTLLVRVVGSQQPVHVAYGDRFEGLLAVA